MMRTSYIRWDHDDIGFILDQRSLLDFNSVTWLTPGYRNEASVGCAGCRNSQPTHPADET